jgi:DNA primase
MKNKGFEVKIISLSWWKDPDEILKSWADFQPYIDKALTPIWYYIEKATFDPNNLDEKKKLLTQLLDIVKSYSDNIERDFYLKEISKLLDISDKIIYDMFNRTRIQKPKDSEKNTWNNRAITSEDLAIWYIINDNDYLSLIQDKIIFKDNIGKDLHNIIDKWLVYLDSIPLGEKERYKWVALKVEMENKQHTEENSEEKLAKLIFWINREIYKNQVESLKNKISSWDANALKEYSELIKLAKSHWIK